MTSVYYSELHFCKGLLGTSNRKKRRVSIRGLFRLAKSKQRSRCASSFSRASSCVAEVWAESLSSTLRLVKQPLDGIPISIVTDGNRSLVSNRVVRTHGAISQKFNSIDVNDPCRYPQQNSFFGAIFHVRKAKHAEIRLFLSQQRLTASSPNR